jgi:hypothetical protein
MHAGRPMPGTMQVQAATWHFYFLLYAFSFMLKQVIHTVLKIDRFG